MIPPPPSALAPAHDARYLAWLAHQRRARVLRIAFDVTFCGVVIAAAGILAVLVRLGIW